MEYIGRGIATCGVWGGLGWICYNFSTMFDWFGIAGIVVAGLVGTALACNVEPKKVLDL